MILRAMIFMVMVMKNYFEIKIYQFSGLFYLVKMGQNFRARPLPLGKAMPERKPSNLRMRCSQSQAGFTLGEEKGEMSELDIFAEMRLQSVCPGWIWRERVGGQVIGRRRGDQASASGAQFVCTEGQRPALGGPWGKRTKHWRSTGIVRNLPLHTALDHFMEHPITIPPPPAHTSYRTFHGFRL